MGMIDMDVCVSVVPLLFPGCFSASSFATKFGGDFW